ncbi:universal stress protein [Microvirgula aerodenitrificans]|uniref:universal stress protein n=1 Tax=Microvirgula aerodenitrificans TaxID=57480 RepID=UPI00248E3CBF|nr:universal stress protein [Microvirgula aerodenitrificans]
MYTRILVPIDGSSTAERGLDAAMDLAARLDATIRIVHIVDPHVTVVGLDGMTETINDFVAQLVEEGKQLLDDAKQKVTARGLKVEAYLYNHVHHTVAATIVEEARAWPADMIVIGSHGRRGVSRAVLGSDADKIACTSPVPVLMVRDTSIDQHTER